ncbi:hypothetical protein ACFO1V_06710 [Daeguia caeni]|uniref:AlgX/AlgJ SGNH hydrolase-like domain-containing protein n=1 Tax=Daeguia caeni TaxID=439612 RepID=A0ABV9H3D2_9HYPH
MLQRLRTLSTLGFLVVVFAGLVSLVVHAVVNRNQDLEQKLTWQSLIDGSFTAAISQSVDKALPSSKTLNGWIDGFLYWSLGDGGPQVRKGCGNWLYLAEELTETPDGDAYLAERVKLAKAIASFVAGQGARLIVVPVPDKAEVATEGLCGLEASAQSRTRLAKWRELSVPLGLNQIDISTNWPMPGYWHTDTHWDQKGAQHAAEIIAATVNGMLGAGETAVDLQIGKETRERIGDLTKLAGLVETANVFGPAPDLEHPVTMQINRSGGLLDEVPAPEVMLLGSSYSLNSNFIEFLQAASAREIVQKSLAGGGFAGAMLDAIKDHPDQFRQVKLVIWEWPARTLTQPLTDQEKAFLADQP